MRESLSRLIDWFRRDRLQQELEEELRFHHEKLERDALAEGASPAEAARFVVVGFRPGTGCKPSAKSFR